MDLKPDLPDAHFRLALVYTATGNSKRAMEELTHTIERDDQNSEAHFLLAEEIAKLGRTKEALEHYERAAQLAPKTIAYQIKLAEANLKLYRYDRAEAAYKQALAASDPRKGEMHYLVGYAARLQGAQAAYDVGVQRTCWQIHSLTDWMGDAGFLKSATSQYRSHVYLGDVVRLGGTVVGKEIDEHGSPVVSLTTWARNQRGQEVMPGTAVVQLPRRAGAGGADDGVY